MPKDTLAQASVLLELERFLLTQPLADDDCPAERQRQQRQQLLQSGGVGDMRLFQAKAPALQTPEQRFDFPPPGVIRERTWRRLWRDDHILARLKAHAAEVQVQAPAPPCAGDDHLSANALRAKQLPDRHQLSTTIRDLCVLFDPDAEINPASFQPAKPLFAGKLPVTSQIGYRVEAAQGAKLADQSLALLSVRVPFLFQHRPQDGNGDALVGNPQDQQIQGRLAQLPVRPVQRQDIGRFEGQQSEQRQGDHRRGQFKEAKKALDALVMRLGCGARERRRWQSHSS